MTIKRITKEDYVELTAPVIKDLRDEDGTSYHCVTQAIPFLSVKGDCWGCPEIEATRISKTEIVLYVYDGEDEVIYLITEE